jgi:hypothetical protein
MNTKITYSLLAIALFSVMVAPAVLTSSVSADKPTSFETCEKQVGKGGTEEGECKQDNKNFEEGECREHVKGKSGKVDRSGQCP